MIETSYKNNKLSPDYDSIKKYLLDEPSLATTTKPILWIHIPYEINSRDYMITGETSSTNLNMPYIYLTIKSIIMHNSDDFHISIIDDQSYHKILPNWQIDMKKLGTEITYVRNLASVKILKEYGGIYLPMSFLCMKSLINMYKTGTRDGTMFVCENVNKNVTCTSFEFTPDIRFIGSNKNNDTLMKLEDFIIRQMSCDLSGESEFLGEYNRWIKARVNSGYIRLIDGTQVGTKTVDQKPVLIDDLLSEDYVDLYKGAYGLWIPYEDILKRTKYCWFADLNAEQVLHGYTFLSKQFLVTISEKGHMEREKIDKPNWINFWRVPSNAPVFGLMPMGLGDNVAPVSNKFINM